MQNFSAFLQGQRNPPASLKDVVGRCLAGGSTRRARAACSSAARREAQAVRIRLWEVAPWGGTIWMGNIPQLAAAGGPHSCGCFCSGADPTVLLLGGGSNRVAAEGRVLPCCCSEQNTVLLTGSPGILGNSTSPKRKQKSYRKTTTKLPKPPQKIQKQKNRQNTDGVRMS